MKLSTKISLSVLMGLGVLYVETSLQSQGKANVTCSAMVCSIKKTISLSAIAEKGDPTCM
jgi:hypothetical protein